jgi:RHH-type rel operon transcriptional repressor/antitoxin RelB
MAVSVRMDPLLERQLEQAARRQGLTQSQFIVNAVERALDRKNPYELLMALKAQEQRPEYQALAREFADAEQPYEPDKARSAILRKLRAKDGGRHRRGQHHDDRRARLLPLPAARRAGL